MTSLSSLLIFLLIIFVLGIATLIIDFGISFLEIKRFYNWVIMTSFKKILSVVIVNFIISLLFIFNYAGCSQYMKSFSLTECFAIFLFWLAGAFVSLIPPLILLYIIPIVIFIILYSYLQKPDFSLQEKNQVYFFYILIMSLCINLYWLFLGCAAMSI